MQFCNILIAAVLVLILTKKKPPSDYSVLNITTKMSFRVWGLQANSGMIAALLLFLVGLAVSSLDYSGIASIKPLEELASHHR